MALTQVYTAIPNDVITAARWNNEFGNIYNNGTALAFPATTSVSFQGQTVYFDTSGVSSIYSPSDVGFRLTAGAKSGTPGFGQGSSFEVVSGTFTDTFTAGSGTALSFVASSFKQPTLAAANSSVVTTNAATVYIQDAVLASTNETITNNWALWIDAGDARFDGQICGLGAAIANELRLSLTTALPVTTADVTGAGTLYLVPYVGKHISLYDGTLWKTFATAQVSLALTLTSGKPYDVFCYISSGAPTLEVLVWTDDTNRATALAYQDGVLVKSGTTTRRYLGTLYATGANTTEDSAAKRNLWNYYNRVPRFMRNAVETTDSWTYTTATWRQANANTANQLECVVGVAEEAIEATVVSQSKNSSASVDRNVGIGVDSTSVNSSTQFTSNNDTFTAAIFSVDIAKYEGVLAAGRHTLVWLERSVASGTATWVGDGGTIYQQSGISGKLRA